MKKRKISAMFTLVVIASLVLLGLFPQAIQADTGPKPSITIEVKNAPQDYYVALLGKKENEYAKNSHLKIDEVTRESVEAYLETFRYDEWYYYKSPLGDNLFRCNEDGKYHFWYMVPKPFRVILIDMEGNVHLSDSLHQWEYNAECTFDFHTGTLIEHRAGAIMKRALIVGGCYGVTLIIEFLVLIGLFPVNKKNLFWFWLANTVTNIPLNIFLLHANIGLGIYIIWFLLELLIILIEGIIYTSHLIDKKGSKSAARAFGYSAIANVLSAFAGVMIQWFFNF